MITLSNNTSLIIAVMLAVVFVSFIAFALVCIFRFFKPKADAADDYIPLNEIQYTNATVIAKDCYMDKNGTRTQSSHHIVYWAEFMTYDGKCIKCIVPVETYDFLQKNQTGTLALCDGKFFCFNCNADREC